MGEGNLTECGWNPTVPHYYCDCGCCCYAGTSTRMVWCATTTGRRRRGSASSAWSTRGGEFASSYFIVPVYLYRRYSYLVRSWTIEGCHTGELFNPFLFSFSVWFYLNVPCLVFLWILVLVLKSMPVLCSESPFEFCNIFGQFSLDRQTIPAVHHTLTVEVPSHLQFGPLSNDV